jgi:ribosomal protein S18 acetylase RimI-like enzyme
LLIGKHYSGKECSMDRDNLSQRSSLVPWQGGGQLLAMKVLTTIYRRMFLMVRPLDATIPDLRPCIPALFKVLTREELLAYNRLQPEQYTSLIQARLACGEQCFAAIYEGRIAQVGSVGTKRAYIPYLRRDLILQPNDVYVYGSFTFPAYRGYGLAPARAVHMMHHYRQEGYRRMVCVVAIENKSGLRVVQKLGYHTIGLYSCLRFGPWQYDWQRTWGEESLPRLARAVSRAVAGGNRSG